MKTKLFLIGFLIIGIVRNAHAQPASAGRAVVSHGFENLDSIRFGMLRPYDVGIWYPDTFHYIDFLIDSLKCNAVENFEMSVNKPFFGHQKAICAMGLPYTTTHDTVNSPYGPNLVDFGHRIFQRIYAPLYEFAENTFRYNDIQFDTIPGVKARLYNNSFDSEDISPYIEYPANPTFVSQTFPTRRFNATKDSIVCYGNEGRVILGYSDERDGNNLLTTPTYYPTGSALWDTAKAFSVSLEFWLDTSQINMTNAFKPTDTDHVPLVRLQVLYKNSGQTVLPFVPFTNGSDMNHGWFKCLDTVITRASYRTLDTDWRAPDSTFNGSGGHNAHNWVFKQFHTMIALSDSMRATMSRRINSNLSTYNTNYGLPLNGSMDTTFTNPDSIVRYSTNIGDSANQLFEIRVLSTYRTTVRVRDVTYQDTIVDRYLNRRLFWNSAHTKDSSHSVEQNGAIGGNDERMNATLHSWDSLMGSNLPRELMYNDIGLSGWGMPGMGYLDYLGSKHQIYVHMRPQDNGDWSLAFRRARMSFDGGMPSIFENQKNAILEYLLPYDFVYYGHHIQRDSLWGHSRLDTLMGQIITRPGDVVTGGTDSLIAYKQFVAQSAIFEMTFNNIRNMNRVASMHPWSKRFATEYSIMLFSYGANMSYFDSSKNHRWVGDSTSLGWFLPPKSGYADTFCHPPFTPQEITTLAYGSYANGSTAISAAESFGNDGGDWYKHDFGVFNPDSEVTTSPITYYQHRVNVGHYFNCRSYLPLYNDSAHTDQDGPLQPYYIGASNTYRALNQAVSCMNTIWGQGYRPMKNFRWLDGYSNDWANTPSVRWNHPSLEDSISKSSAFLKVEKTVPINPWHRNSDSSYIGSSTQDPDTLALAEVGLFVDSISTSQKNYAALVINTRCWPGRDTADLNYYNNGLDSISKIHPTLGDIDVRKVYLKLDLTKTDPAFSGHIYYVVRDLWHPDSTWLLNKDSTFAIYIKPGDAKFLYFEPGIAVNVAARTGTDTGFSTQAEFGFNNGRRVAEILHGTHDVITYTRNHHVYVSYPAAGSTFGGSPDLSSGDNIITGYELALDTTHFCARPSIAVAMNDTGVALAYWDSSGTGKIAAAYRKAPGSAWQIVTFDTIYPDTSFDHHMVTPVITPINDTSWLIAAGRHRVVPGGPAGIIWGQVLMTPASRTAYAGPVYPLWSDITRPDGSIAQALFPTLASRRLWGASGNVHLAWQQDTIAYVNQIYFKRFSNLPSSISSTLAEDISVGLGACDNIHPSLALGGTYEYAGWLLPGFLLGYDSFYHDQLAWESRIDWVAFPWLGGGGGTYWPVIRARHEGYSPTVYPESWGTFSVFKDGSTSYHLPQINAEDRRWDYKFAAPSDTSHDWIRMMYQSGTNLRAECWSPNWYYFTLNENGNEPSIPLSTGDFGPWPDSGAVGRSICWTATGTNQNVRVTNGYLPRIRRKASYPIAVMYAGKLSCDSIVIVGFGPPRLVPPTGPPAPVSWKAASPSLSGPSASWTNPEQIPNIETSSTFLVSACDSIIVPRNVITTGLTVIQDSLRSSSDYVMFRLLLRRAIDSLWIGTVDSMIVKRSSIYWPGVTVGIEADTARYKFPCGFSSDSVFLSMDAERGDTTNSIVRSYATIIDTDSTAPPAEKRAEHPTVMRVDTGGLQVTVHPNPARTMVEICVEDLPEGVPASAIVVNQGGETVATLYNATPDGELGLCMRLNCSNLPSGTYYAYIQNAVMGTAVKFQVIK